MMKMTTRSLVLRCMSVVIVFGAFLLSIMLLVPATVSADALQPKWVQGYIVDVEGRHLPGADVSVTIDGNTKTETADSDGFYQVQFGMTEWTIGHDITVVATYNSQQATNVTPADSNFVQVVWVVYPYEIPQFGGSFGLLLAGGFVAAVSIALLVDKKRK